MAVGGQDLRHRGPRVHHHACLGQQPGQRVPKPGQAALHVPGSPGMLQVRDAADRRRRPVGGGPGVGRVPAHVLDQPRVGEEPARQPGQRLPGRAGEQVGQAGLAAGQPGQVQRAGQEGPLARGPAPFPPLEIPLPGPALPGREPLHLRGHRARIAARVQDAAVREVIPAHRIDLGQGHQLVQLAAGLGGERAEQVREGQQGRAEPEREAGPAQLGQLAAQLMAALEQLDPVPPGGQPDRGGHAAHPAADHHDITHGRCNPPVRLRVRRRAQASAAGMPMPSAPATTTARPCGNITANPTASITAITV